MKFNDKKKDDSTVMLKLPLRRAGLLSVKSATFGMTRKTGDGFPKAHQGIDIACEPGTVVAFPIDGVVVDDYVSESYGKTLTVKDGLGYFWFFAHLSQVLVKKGDVVTTDQEVALSGCTGNAKGQTSISRGSHLHLEIRKVVKPAGGLADRIDPILYMKHLNLPVVFV